MSKCPLISFTKWGLGKKVTMKDFLLLDRRHDRKAIYIQMRQQFQNLNKLKHNARSKSWPHLETSGPCESSSAMLSIQATDALGRWGRRTLPAMGSQEVDDCKGRRGATHPLPLHSRQLHARLQDTTCKQDGRQANTVKWAVGEIDNVKNRFNLFSIQRVKSKHTEEHHTRWQLYYNLHWQMTMKYITG